MWDLDTLHRLNERAVREYRKSKTAEKEPKTLLPIEELALRLTVAPPSLAALIDLFEESESMGDFLGLVREYLPRREREIMFGPTEYRVARFCTLFEQKYFPLADPFIYDELDLPSFCSFIPIDLHGFSYDDYHNFEGFYEGILMMMALVADPYDEDQGGRVPIIEEVAKYIGKQLASEISKKGWEPAELHQMTDGTKYDGLAACADWLHASTGCMVLDATYDEYSGEAWDHALVDSLAADWPKVKEIQSKIDAFADWLQDDPSANFQELLYFLLDRKDDIVPKEQLRLPLDENGQVEPKKLIEIFGNERRDSESENVQAAAL